MPIAQEFLRVYETGPVTVLGFGGQGIVDQIDLGQCRTELLELLEQHGCRVLGLDLTGVRYVPSGFLGLLASFRRQGIDVHLYNPSEDVREVLEVTKLSTIFELHELEI